MTRQLAREFGLPVGISSGANVLVSLEITRKYNWRGGEVVTVLPDRIDRYLSLGIFD